MQKNKIIRLMFISFLVICNRLFAQEIDMKSSKIYEEILSTAKQENWKQCFLDGDEKGNNAIKVHDFKSGDTSAIYSFSVNALAELVPSISRRGDKIGFWLKDDHRNNSLYIINTDGSNLEKIITIASGHGVAWSYDDKKIAFVGSLTKNDLLENDASLYVVDIKDKKVKVIVKNHVSGITNQSWSPDGQKILYGHKGSLINCNLSTNESFKIAEGDWCGWSFNGDWVAYAGEGKIKLINPDTLEQRTLVENNGIVVPIYWLPNGEYIVYGIIAPNAEIGSPYVIRLSDKKTESIPDMFWMLASWAEGRN